jgi:hypothetical protein
VLRPGSALAGIPSWTSRAPIVAAAVVAAFGVGQLLPARVDSLSTTRVVALIGGLVFLTGVIWLALRRPVATLALGFGLLLFVRAEPAPVDLVFAILILVSVVSARPRPRVPIVVAIPLSAFGLVTLASTMNAVGTMRAIRFEFITVYVIALAVWLTWVVSDRRNVAIAMKAYIIAAVVSGVLGILAVFAPIPGKSVLTFGGVRAEGLFKDPNVYSAFLVPAAILLLEELVSPRLLGWSQRVVTAAFVIVTIGVVVAYSRAAWLNYALGVMTLVVVQTFRRGGYKLAVKSVSLILACALAGLGLLAVTGSLTFLRQRSHLEGYDRSRFAAQASAFSGMTKHVFGYGPGQVEEHLAISTHSAFARAAFEQGLLGVASFSLILLTTLACALLLVRRRTHVNGVGTATLLAVWIGQAVNGFFIDTFHWRHLWIFAGLIWSYYVASRDGSAEPFVDATLAGGRARGAAGALRLPAVRF